MILSEIAVVSIRNIEKKLKEKTTLKKFFSDEEIAYCCKFKNPAIHFAGKLAAKKAFRKILEKTGESYSLSDIKAINLSSGKPVISFNKRDKIHLSVSHTKDIAVALCIYNV